MQGNYGQQNNFQHYQQFQNQYPQQQQNPYWNNQQQNFNQVNIPLTQQQTQNLEHDVCCCKFGPKPSVFLFSLLYLIDVIFIILLILVGKDIITSKVMYIIMLVYVLVLLYGILFTKIHISIASFLYIFGQILNGIMIIVYTLIIILLGTLIFGSKFILNKIGVQLPDALHTGLNMVSILLIIIVSVIIGIKVCFGR